MFWKVGVCKWSVKLEIASWLSEKPVQVSKTLMEQFMPSEDFLMITPHGG